MNDTTEVGEGMKRCEIILAGIGGQGLLLSGLILGDSAAISEKLYAVQIESYAPLARGGSSSSDIVISDEEITYPRIEKADILIALASSSYNENKHRVKEDGVILFNSNGGEIEDDPRVIKAPLTDIAVESTKRAITVSMVSLGFIPYMTYLVSMRAITSSIARKAPTGTAEVNISAAEAGAKFAEELFADKK